MHHKLSGLAKKYQSWELTVVNTCMSCPPNLHSLFIHFYVKKRNFFTTHQTWKQLLLWALNLLLKRHQLQHFMTVTKRKKSWISCHRVKERKKFCNQSSDWYFDTAPGDKIAIKVCFANSLIWSTSALHVKVLHPHSHIVWLFQRNVAL